MTTVLIAFIVIVTVLGIVFQISLLSPQTRPSVPGLRLVR